MAVLIKKAETGLTNREQEVIKWIARGCSNKQIAGKLFISEETVKKHVKNIFIKLNVTNRIAALRRAGML